MHLCSLHIEMGAGAQEVRKTWQAWASATADACFPSADEARQRRRNWIEECLASGAVEIAGFKQKTEGCAEGELRRVSPGILDVANWQVGPSLDCSHKALQSTASEIAAVLHLCPCMQCIAIVGHRVHVLCAPICIS